MFDVFNSVRFLKTNYLLYMENYSKKELETLILEQNKSYSSIGRLYGVSGNAVKKTAKKLGIKLPRRRVVNEKENFSNKGFKKTSLVNKPTDEEFISIVKNSKTWVEIAEKLGYKNGASSNVKQSIESRCSMLGVELIIDNGHNDDLLDMTKGELFNDRKNWQSARSAIQKLARASFKEANPNPKCLICGYSNHVEVAHIKPVSDFDDSATVREINSLSNLIGLCPNHHWEYDNGILKI